MLSNALFSIQLALLFTHEMDAARRQEWKMFAFLKHQSDESSFMLFTLAHIPLYAAFLFLLISSHRHAAFVIADIFLIIHSFSHMLFHRHPLNKLRGKMSLALIHLAAILALFHLMGLFL